MSDETNRKELTARLDSDLYEGLREATYNLRISKQQAITEALRMWLRSNSTIGLRDSSPPDSRIPVDMLPVVNWLVRLWGRKGTPEQEGLKSLLKALAASSETERKGHTNSAP
jgi:hypothetical protein